MIKLKNINKTFQDKEIFKNLTLEINKGESVAILGKSGIGKTTLLNIMGMIEPVDSGELYIDNKRINSINEKVVQDLRKTKIGYLFQNFGLIDNQSIYENLKIPFEFSKISKQKLTQKMNELLLEVGLVQELNTKVYSLSGGEQQRLSIARTLMKDPTLIFADEPTGSLDLETGKKIMNIFMKLQKKSKCTIVIVTHDKEIANFCDRTIDLNKY